MLIHALVILYLGQVCQSWIRWSLATLETSECETGRSWWTHLARMRGLLVFSVLVYCYSVQALEPATNVNRNEALLFFGDTSWFSLGRWLAHVLYKNHRIRRAH